MPRKPSIPTIRQDQLHHISHNDNNLNANQNNNYSNYEFPVNPLESNSHEAESLDPFSMSQMMKKMQEVADEVKPPSVSTPSIPSSEDQFSVNNPNIPIDLAIPSIDVLPIPGLKESYDNSIDSVQEVYNDYIRSLDVIESLKGELSLVTQLDQKKIALGREYETVTRKLSNLQNIQ